ncbi:hypothetical protein [Nonomuraea sp. PA05]|uniref:cation transporter dimerization domain-containing protein n=1 Tax=Nonomuraea sp. PA05 TaxID=2604466 RepID=UPI001652B5A4|nr:hypothetical protein [Nonomuraea sp. PA05]
MSGGHGRGHTADAVRLTGFRQAGTIAALVVAARRDVEKVHDLHVRTVTSGYPALSAHVLVARGAGCHRVRTRLADLLHERFAIGHTTLQVDHGVPGLERHCVDPHGPRHPDPLKSPYGEP